MSRIEFGALEVEVVSTEVCSVVRAAASELIERARRDGIAVIVRQGPSELWAMADAIRMHQVASNLISNAVKYNRPGGSVVFEMSAEDEWARLAVTDTGERLTSHQGSTRCSSRIGRAITRHPVGGMGGRIDVQSQPQKGSRVSTSLRRARTCSGRAVRRRARSAPLRRGRPREPAVDAQLLGTVPRRGGHAGRQLRGRTTSGHEEKPSI